MNLAFRKLRRVVPDLNKRSFTLTDFYRICLREKVKVHEMPLRVPGFYMTDRGKAHIYLNSSLRGVEFLLAALHELGHHFLHAPPMKTVAYFYRLPPNSKKELEAQAFALVALIPDSLLKKFLASEEYAEDWGFAEEILKERSDLFIRYSTN
jgi:Zn-dependent peptidase ImmA (M78 family)